MGELIIFLVKYVQEQSETAYILLQHFTFSSYVSVVTVELYKDVPDQRKSPCAADVHLETKPPGYDYTMQFLFQCHTSLPTQLVLLDIFCIWQKMPSFALCHNGEESFHKFLDPGLIHPPK